MPRRPADPATERQPPATDRLPTLTEVVHVGTDLPPPPTLAETIERQTAAPSPDVDASRQAWRAELREEFDRLLQTRLREALDAALDRATQQLAGDLHRELTPALEGLLQEAIERVGRPPG